MTRMIKVNARFTRRHRKITTQIIQIYNDKLILTKVKKMKTLLLQR